MKSDAAKRIMLAQSLGKYKGEVTPEAQAIRDDALQEILLTLWDTDDLQSLIKTEHENHCKQCPVRRKYEHELLGEESAKKNRDEQKDEWKELAWKLLKIVAFVTVAAMAILGRINGTDVSEAHSKVMAMP